jgi:signal transduction histidine kinase/DNA-binding response OmpR family regulator
MKSKDAKLYFGTTNGFTILDPRKISINSHVPKVIISEFFINYKPTKLNIQHKPQTDEITLKYNENNFGFKFSSDNFLIPEKTKFKYRLKGYDEDWIQVTSHNRTANYSKVPAGVYYFEVLATNNDGIWSNKPTRLKVIQYPAPWFSTPAYILYFIISIILIFYIIRYFKTKKELKLQLYLENIEKQKKDEINQSQLRFFTNISHDFKTPLSLIIASLDSLRKEGLKEYYYNILNNNAKRLLNLVNELMDFRAIEYGKIKLEVEPLNFNKFITNISADFNDLARQKNISYDISCDSEMPQKLYFDKNIIEKVVMNLLHNAFKYTKANGQISIKTHTKVLKSKFSNNYVVESDYKTENCFYLTVSDSGVGISKDSIKTIFERFYKVSSNNLDSHLGTGIGLGLVKSLVMLHRGTITVSSERTKGTSITVGFSFDKDIYDKENIIEKNDVEDYDEEIDDEINEMSTPRIPQKNKKKILFAEDNEELRTLISDYLSSDFDIIQAEDGMIAKKILSTKYIDLVISDIMMPGMDGITLSKNIKSNIETSHIPLMLLTAKSGTESKIEGADSGADYYFEKPISPELLKKTIENIFKQQQQLREYYAKNNFANNAEFTSNDRDAEFIRDFIEVININIKDSNTNINNIATAMSMSRSKLYRKIKTMTGMSIIEFILNYKLKKAAKLIIEEDITMREVMDIIGIESQAYFTNAFKKEFGETPTAFAARHKKQT